MRLILPLFVSFLTATFGLSAQPIAFGDSTIVSLITCEPGKALYAKFGHTAIRVRDTEGLDLTYNYGLFDFRTEYFYWKFMRGHTDYLLGVYPTKFFLHEYEERNSTVWEQVLNMTGDEKKSLITFLNINLLPENMMYRYNFVYDNCTTRSYDAIQKVFAGFIKGEKKWKSKTFRSMIMGYLSDSPWTKLGINLIFGLEADEKINEQAGAFLPENLKDFFQTATLLDFREEGKERSIVEETKLLVKARPESVELLPWLLHPLTVALICFFIGLVLIYKRDKDHAANKILDCLLYFVTGLVGLLIFFFMFFSEHPMMDNNLNILWLNPFNLLLAVMLWKRSSSKFFFFYHLVYLSLIISYWVICLLTVHFAVVVLFPLQVLIFIRVIWGIRIRFGGFKIIKY